MAHRNCGGGDRNCGASLLLRSVLQELSIGSCEIFF